MTECAKLQLDKYHSSTRCIDRIFTARPIAFREKRDTHGVSIDSSKYVWGLIFAKSYFQGVKVLIEIHFPKINSAYHDISTEYLGHLSMYSHVYWETKTITVPASMHPVKNFFIDTKHD